MKFIENIFIRIFPEKINSNIPLYNFLVILCSILFFIVSEVVISGIFAFLGFVIIYILEKTGHNLEMAGMVVVILMAGLGGLLALALSILLLFKNLR
ncbi:MAG: hypothetical protein PHF84_05260 [bacterium]|nr:hypothetical protein [bacterium]